MERDPRARRSFSTTSNSSPALPGQTEHHHRDRGRRGFHRIAGFIEHGAHAPEFTACQDVIAALERAFPDQGGDDGAAPLLHARFHDKGGRRPAVRCLQFQHFGLQQDGLEQLVDACARAGRDVGDMFRPPQSWNGFLLASSLPDLLVGVRLVDS
jgi:hypothetical protein